MSSAIQLAADTGGGYVAAAYAVFIALLLVYVGIMARRLSGIQKSLSEIIQQLRGRE